MSVLNRDTVMKTMQGYREVNQITDRERCVRLKNLTDTEARLGFEQLLEGMFKDNQNNERCFDERDMAHELRFRQAVLKLSQKLGYESPF